MSYRLAWCRIQSAAGTLLEILGGGLTTYSLSSLGGWQAFLLGTSLLILGAVAGSHARNCSGSIWSIDFRLMYGQLGFHHQMIETVLIDAGIPAEVTETLQEMSSEVYSDELKSPKMQEFEHIVRPLANALAMIVYGDWWLGLVVASVGLCFAPIGRLAMRWENRRRAKTYAGSSAMNGTYLWAIFRARVVMTDILNTIPYASKAVFALKYILGSGNLLAALNGLADGLGGLSGSLTFQQSKVRAHHNSRVVSLVIETLGSPPFITSQSWQEHVAQADKVVSYPPVPFESGLILRQFQGILPSKQATRIKPLDLELPAGQAVILQAASGTGKTMTFLALLHMLDHTGDELIADDHKLFNVHDLTGPEEVLRYITFISDDNIKPASRIADLFAPYFEEANAKLYHEHLGLYPKVEVEVAWRMSDNLLESNISALEAARSARSSTAFGKHMPLALKQIRERRLDWVNRILEAQDGNLSCSQVHAERNIGSLSSGEKRRLLAAAAAASRRRILIFDEPLSHLDERNRSLQLDRLAGLMYGDIQHGRAPSALIVVAHEHTDQLRSALGGCPIIKLG